MSGSLTAVQQIEYDSYVKAAYASKGFKLRGTTRSKHNVVGNSVDWRKTGEVISQPTGYSVSVTVQDPGYNKVNTVLQKHTAAIGIDSVQELTVNFDSKMESAHLVAAAMGRRSDQICLDSFVGAAANTIADGGTNFTYAKFTQMQEFFDDYAVPEEERFVAMSAANFRSLLAAQEFTNLDYTQNRVLDKAFALEYLGFNLIKIPTMTEGGLPKAGNIRNAYAWHKQAVGMGVGADFRTEINYLPKETTWLVNGIFSAGASVIDDEGLLQINCDESA